MHVPAGGPLPHSLSAGTIHRAAHHPQDDPQKSMHAAPPPERGANPPRIPGAPRAVLLNQVRAVFAGRTEPVWLLH